MVPHRPHERIWNFEYDDPKTAPKHVLRPDADPKKCYIDGRVEKLIVNLILLLFGFFIGKLLKLKN